MKFQTLETTMKSKSMNAFSALLFAFGSAVSALAATETINGIKWTFTTSSMGSSVENGEFPGTTAIPTSTYGAITIPSMLGGRPVTRIGNFAFYGCDHLTSVTIPNTVTSIGFYAFRGCSNLTSATIPVDVTNIGDFAFYGCGRIKSVVIPVGVTNIGFNTFEGCSGLTSIVIGNNVTNIEMRAFCGCSSLSTLTIPNNVIRIGSEAFEDCSGLSSVIIGNGVKVWGSSAFEGCSNLTSLTFTEGVTCIGTAAFRDCSSLASVTIPDGVKIIESSAFAYCSSLSSVMIPMSVTTIGSSAFSHCNSALYDTTSITGVKLVDGWTVGHDKSLSGDLNLAGCRGIGGESFRDCKGLTSVLIGDGVTTIGSGAFNCSSLTSVRIPDSVKVIEDCAFYTCRSLTSVTIPDSVEVIGDSAFGGCNNLATMTISNGVTSVGNNAFNGCSGLTSITIPDTVTNMGYQVFLCCTNLTSATIGNGLSSIENYSFASCSRLISVTIGNGVTNVGNAVFSGCSSLETIEIPECLCSFLTKLKTGNSATIIIRSATGERYQLVTFSDSALPEGQVGTMYLTRLSSDSTGSSNPHFSCSSLPSGLTLSEDGWLTGVPREAVENHSVTITTDNGQSHTFTLTIHPLGYGWLTSGIWKYEVENDEVVIRRCSQTTGSVTVPETINGYPVRTIEAAHVVSFDEFGSATNIFIPAVVFESGITSIEFPSSLRNLGAGAVAASGISELTIPAGVTNVGYYAATLCRGLQSVQIGAGVKTIQDAAFTDCSDLQAIIVPNTVRKMGIALFERCSRLESASIHADCPIVPASIFHQCVKLSNVSLPPHATNIQSLAFANCSQLRSIDIPESVQELGFGCFAGCARLSSFDCPDALQRIMGKGFSGCTNLASIQFNESLRQIWTNAFENCTSLGSITLPDSLEMLSPESLKGCKSIVTLSLPFIGISTNVPANSEWSGLGAVFGVEPYEGSVETTQVFDPERGLVATWHLPGTLKTVELRGNLLAPGAFSGCRTLENIRLTGAPARIPDYAFAGCEGIRTISLPDSVEEIGAAAFGSCSALETVHLSAGLRTVDLIPFWQCTNLTEATWGTTGTLRMEDPNGRFFSLGPKTEEEDYLAWTVETENPRDWIEWLVAGTGERRATGPAAGIRLSDTRSFLVRVTDMSTTAADTAILRFHDTASAPWIVTEDESAKGGFCLRSGEIPASTNSTIEATITGPGRLSFKWKISAGRGDFCKFYLDGTETNSIGTRNGAMTDWATVTLDLPAGPHALRWSYERGSGDAVGEDAAFLDDVDWRPEVSLSVASAWGDATPATGLHTVLCGDEIEASVVAPPAEGGMRWVCSGWTGTGIVPASGTGSNALFVVTNDASLVWNWRNEYWTVVSVSGGTTSFAPKWIAENEMVSVEILPTPHLYTISLSGDTDGAVVEGTILRFPADKPRSIQVEVFETTAALTVSSAHGNPSPGTGSHSFTWGTTVSASVASAIQQNGTKHECTGWTGTGSVPAHGSGSSVSFSITNDSSIVWNWKTMFKTQLNVIGGSGDIRLNNAVTIGNNGEIWSSSGASLRFDVNPAFHLYNVTLTGDTQGLTLSGTTLSCVADRPRSITMLIEEVKLPLTVASVLGSPSPTNGVHALSWGTEVSACVAEPEPDDGVRYVCAGWTGTGSVPASGDGTNVTFRIEESSSIRWNWRTNVWIALSTSGPVSADFVEAWTNIGEMVVAGWTPSVPYFTVALSGDADGVTLDEAARTISIPADRPRNVALSVTELTLAGALDAPGLVWTTDGDAVWFPQVATSADGEDAARSGSVLGSQASTIQTTLEGSGTFSWTWRLDSATGGNAGVDVLLDGSWKSLYAPGADWSAETLAIVGEGPHTVRFEFWNAGTEATAGDCAYLDQVSWTGEVPGGRKIVVEGVKIPFAWIETNASAALAAAGGDYEAAAKGDASNGENKVWECYVAGLSPTNAAERFLAIVNTTNGMIAVNWTPDLNEGGTKNLRVYTVEGKTNLVDRSWGVTNEATRFFRVKVGMPE